MSKKPKAPEQPKTSRLETTLKGREFIEEYVKLHFEDLLKLRSGTLAVQTICKDLGILDNDILINVANSVWLELAGNELEKAKAKAQTKAAVQQAIKPNLDTKYQDDLLDMVKQLERDSEATAQVFGDALEHLLDQLAAPPAPKPLSWLQRAVLTFGMLFSRMGV